jgi:hypothetical protein
VPRLPADDRAIASGHLIKRKKVAFQASLLNNEPTIAGDAARCRLPGLTAAPPEVTKAEGTGCRFAPAPEKAVSDRRVRRPTSARRTVRIGASAPCDDVAVLHPEAPFRRSTRSVRAHSTTVAPALPPEDLR